MSNTENMLTIDDIFTRVRVNGSLESNACNKALQDYCEMGAARSLTKLHQQYEEQAAAVERGDPTTELPPTTNLKTLQRWSANYKFVSRSTNYDRLIAEERVAMDAQLRIEEREKRRAVLDNLRLKVEAMMDAKDLMTDVKKFRAMMDSAKIYMQASMAEFNDMPQSRVDVTTKDQPISVNFITEPIAQSVVNARLEMLGLAEFAEETSEHDIDGDFDAYSDDDYDNYSHLELMPN